jgi:hypothetical protein
MLQGIGRAAVLASVFAGAPSWAVSCMAGLPVSLSASAISGHPSQGIECKLDGESMISVTSVLRSTLVRARGQLGVRFIDRSGRVASTWRSEPLLGRFSGLRLQSVIPVPASADRFAIELDVTQGRSDRLGSIETSVERIEPGALITAKSSSGSSVTRASNAGTWALTLVGGPSPLVANLQVRDIDGTVKSRQVLTLSANVSSSYTAPVLTPGYYELIVDASPAGTAPVHLERPFVVVPRLQPDKRIGMDAALSWYGGDVARVKQHLDLVRLAGAGIVRDRFRWSDVQPHPGAFDWKQYRANAMLAAQAGLEVVTAFHDSPAWTRPVDGRGSGDRAPATDLEAIRAFGAAFARDMGPAVQAVEFWNEQNSDFFPGYPFQYAAQLKSFSIGIRSQRPSMLVLIGASAGQPGPFFEALYSNGLAPFFDVRNQHYYGDTDTLPTFVKGEVLPLERAGEVAQKPGWLTEVGYSLSRDHAGDLRQSERRQAEYLVRAYAMGLAMGYERVFFFFLGELLEDEIHTWGVLRSDLSPRPAYASLALLAAQLAGREVVGVRRDSASTVVYLKTAAGAMSAIAWGTGNASALAGRFASASDMWGRPATSERGEVTLTAAPLYLSGVRPAGSIQPLEQRAAASAPAAGIFMAADVDIDGKTLPAPPGNKVAVSVADGQVIRLSGEVRLPPGPLTRRDFPTTRCVGGPGMSLRSDASSLATNKAATPRFHCEFDTAIASIGRSFVAVDAGSSPHGDRIYVPVEASAASFSAARSRPMAFGTGGACRKWVSRSSANMPLVLDQASKLLEGCALAVVGEIKSAGETWAFPATRVAPGEVDGVAIEVTIGTVDGAMAPPVNLSLQFVERTGAVWTLALERIERTPTASTFVGQYALAKGAAWSLPKSDKLNTTLIQEMAIGWGGFGGEPGQRFGYGIRRVEILSRRP